MAGFVVVLDANVLYGIEVTELFATMATRRIFRPHWSPQILNEVKRNLALRPDLEPAAITRRLDFLNRALPDALTDVPRELIRAMPVNENDRHVLALAVHVGAPTVVTDNVADFPAELVRRRGRVGRPVRARPGRPPCQRSRRIHRRHRSAPPAAPEDEGRDHRGVGPPAPVDG